MKEITIFTDGSATTKGDRLGGIGVYIKEENKEILKSKGFSSTTISRMEIRAVILALKCLKNESSLVYLYSDSAYVVNSLTKGWLSTWQMRNFVNVKHRDLWEEILGELNRLKNVSLYVRWIKGHKTNIEDDLTYGNAVADILCSYKNFEKYEKDEIRST